MKDKKESCLEVVPIAELEELSWRGSRKTDLASDADENGSQDPSSELIKRIEFLVPADVLYLKKCVVTFHLSLVPCTSRHLLSRSQNLLNRQNMYCFFLNISSTFH